MHSTLALALLVLVLLLLVVVGGGWLVAGDGMDGWQVGAE